MGLALPSHTSNDNFRLSFTQQYQSAPSTFVHHRLPNITELRHGWPVMRVRDAHGAADDPFVLGCRGSSSDNFESAIGTSAPRAVNSSYIIQFAESFCAIVLRIAYAMLMDDEMCLQRPHDFTFYVGDIGKMGPVSKLLIESDVYHFV